MCVDLCSVIVLYYVSLQLTEAGVSGASGRHAAQTVQCGGAGSAPSPHLALGAKTARGSTSSLSTARASSVHKVSAPFIHIL